MTNVLLLTGPNLSQLGVRQPEIYGSETLDQLVDRLTLHAKSLGLTLQHVGSEAEADLVSAVHAARTTTSAIVINPGALTHYGWSIGDALAGYPGYKVEVHLTNVLTREHWRHTSTVGPYVNATIIGFGGDGFVMALDAVARQLAPSP
jgi:3-dehydroquinate dehydratase-2